jgi:predicted nucleic acid-binding protein
MKPVPSVRSAIDLLQKTTDASNSHQLWADDLPLSALSASIRRRLQGHNQITDAYLLTLAMRHGGRLATFDYR